MLDKFKEQSKLLPEFFAGANSADGFYSCFEDMYSISSGDIMYILKGGPGTGKSTLMKNVTKKLIEKGEKATLFYCSSDPDSLDGAVFEKSGTGIADGTAPHIMEARFLGVCERIVPLSECLDNSLLYDERERLLSLYALNSSLHKKASRLIRAAGRLLDDSFAIDCRRTDLDKAADFARKLADRVFVEKNMACDEDNRGSDGRRGEGREIKRFLSGITPKGTAVFSKTPKKLCEKVITVEDRYGGASSVIMSVLRERALREGLTVYVCPCALHPSRKIDHILIPQKNVAFCTVNRTLDIETDTSRKIHARRFKKEDRSGEYQSRLKFNAKASEELIGAASQILKQAKTVHDQIESFYITAMNFDGCKAYENRVVREISNRL